MISFQFSVGANTRPALSCPATANDADPMRKICSWFLDLFDQTKKHPFDPSDAGFKSCKLFVGKQVQVSSKKNVVLQFAGRPKRNEEKLSEFRIGRPATTFGDICRNGSCGAPYLASQSEQFLFREEAGDRVQAQCQSVTFPPDEQLGEILHERASREEVYCFCLELNADNCKLLRSGYAHGSV